MRKEVSTTELRGKLGKLLDGVHRDGDRLIVNREKSFSVLDRIWEKVPVMSAEEAQADIEQAITEARAEKTRKRSKMSP
ncbi:MAG: hypothetical protein OXG97_20465 [Candidatus Poribacteria bacterium]|nr:hypothetical protein [Candidatus Poribacteria bacterium]